MKVFVVTEDSFSTIDEIVTVVRGVHSTYDIALESIKKYTKEKGYSFVEKNDREYVYKDTHDEWNQWEYDYRIEEFELDK